MLVVVLLVRGSINKAVAPATTLVLCVAAGVVAYISMAHYIRPDLVKAILEMVGHSLFPSKSVTQANAPLSRAKYIEAETKVESS